MRPVTAILIAVSLIAVGGAGMFAKKAVESRARETAASMAERQRDVEVLVAARDLPQGRTLTNDDMAWIAWPVTTAEAAKVIVRLGGQDPLQHLHGTALRRNVVAGEPMSDTMVFTPGRGSLMTGVLAPGKRAVGVVVSAAATASGFVLPGDHVDVVLSLDLKKNSDNQQSKAKFATETVLTDVRVLAVDQEMGGASGATKASSASKKKKKTEKDKADGEGAPEDVALVGKTVALEVTPEQAERVLTAQQLGKLTLTLRALADGTEDSGRTLPYVTDGDISKALNGSAGSGIKIIKAGAK